MVAQMEKVLRSLVRDKGVSVALIEHNLLLFQPWRIMPI